jgi:hypothetical protein
MKKVELIELMRARFPNVQPGEIEFHIGRAINQIIYEVFRNDLSNLDLYTKEYTGVAVLQNPTTDEYYCLLPEQICQLPDHAEGVRRVRKMKSKSLDFVPIQKDSESTFEGMIGVGDSTIGYSVSMDRIIWESDPQVTEVRMDLVIPFEKYDYEDNIYIPAGQDNNVELAIAKFIEGSPPENNRN